MPVVREQERKMWDRSRMGMTGSELEILEALRALERVLCGPEIGERARQTLRAAIGVLHGELDQAAPTSRSGRGPR
jgi:hypothetical protein